MTGATLDPAYRLCFAVPSAEDYCRLRAIAGLSPHSLEAAAKGLPNTIVGVLAHHGDALIGMGRAIGDGGLFFQIVDMAVDPAHQGRGVGHAIMGRLMAALAERFPADAYVSLIADGDAHRLYARHGFTPTAPASIGMARRVGDKRPENSSPGGGGGIAQR